MKEQKAFYISLGLIISVFTPIILDSLNPKLSALFVGIVLMSISIAFTAFVNHKNAYSRKINIISSLVMLMMSFGITIGLILITYFPQFSDNHVTLTTIIISLGIIGTIASVIFWIWNFKTYSKEKR